MTPGKGFTITREVEPCGGDGYAAASRAHTHGESTGLYQPPPTPNPCSACFAYLHDDIAECYDRM